jgi:curved DNA-binding protein CbpA
MQDSKADNYEVLQVHPSAHPDVIQAAYRRLTLLYHPDRNPSPDANRLMAQLNLAYEVLSDPDKRAAYDRSRRLRGNSDGWREGVRQQGGGRRGSARSGRGAEVRKEPHSPASHNGRDEDPSAQPNFRLKLGRTYYNQGFFNVTVAFDKFVRPDEGPVTLALDGYGEINAKVNRSANLNGTARVMGGKSLRDWFRRMHSEGDTVPVRIDTPYWMTLGVN